MTQPLTNSRPPVSRWALDPTEASAGRLCLPGCRRALKLMPAASMTGSQILVPCLGRNRGSVGRPRGLGQELEPVSIN
jgi:hypothetical protein